ncbi:MAG: 2Fe-2S iron-sulfur cluster-binding protein, partial [Terracidiphilus sp.]
MAVTLTINGQTVEAKPGLSLFDQAEALGIDVPTSCRKQGKCKECMIEVVEGMDALSPLAEPEKHLKGNFRLSCQTCVIADSGHVRCHTMRRGHMRIERQAIGLPVRDGLLKLDPAVTRDGDRILLDGIEIARSTGPIHGLAMDLGTTTVVLRLIDLETGELIADTSFENPQRFGGAEVMSRIAYDTDHPGRLLMRTLAGYIGHAIEKFPVDPATIYETVVV